MNMEKRIVLLVISLFLLGQVSAQIITDRPDQTESSTTIGKGNLQIESGFFIGFEGNKSSNRQILAPTNLFRFGLTKNIELRLLSQYETFKNSKESIQGISDIEIGTKIQLFKKESSSTEIAFLSQLILPTGSIELSNEKYGTINKILVSHTINERVGIGYNLGYNYFGEKEEAFTYTLALGIAINDKVGVYIEPYGEIINFDEHIANFNAGLTYLANNNLQFDFSFGNGINTRMNFISVGFSWLFKRE
jgi:hypothetical protein